MATTAKADVNEITWGEHVFQFDGGSRQVTEAERTILERYMEEGGPVKVTFETTKAKSK